MGTYEENLFAFEVESLRHIMDLIIEPSFARAVCFQFHQMPNNSYKVFWNFGMTSRKITPLILKYVEDNSIDKKLSITAVLEDENFAKFIKLHSPIYDSDLSNDDMKIVNAVVNADWKFLKKRGGLDGHSYKIKIYGEKMREYNCWCYIPKEYKNLIPLVDFLIEVAKLEPKNCYAVSGMKGD